VCVRTHLQPLATLVSAISNGHFRNRQLAGAKLHGNRHDVIRAGNHLCCVMLSQLAGGPLFSRVDVQNTKVAQWVLERDIWIADR